MLLPFGMCLIYSDDDGDSRLYRVIYFYKIKVKISLSYIVMLRLHRVPVTYNVTMWCFRVTLAMETQQHVPFVR